MTSNHDESSMPAKRKKQQRQMTLWESDDCVVPLTSGNAERGKAVKRVNWVLDADIKGFFDDVDFGKLLELLGRRIEDTRMLRLITKFLHAGVMIQDQRHDTTRPRASRKVRFFHPCWPMCICTMCWMSGSNKR